MAKKKNNTFALAMIALVSVILVIGALSLYFVFKPSGDKSGTSDLVAFGSQSFVKGSEIQIKGGVMDITKIQGSVSVTCTPASGYTKCFAYKYEEDSGGDAVAEAYVEIHGNENLQGTFKSGEYYVGDVSLKYKFVGDKYYVYENVGTWDNLWNNIAKCDKNGCRGGFNLDREGEYVLASVGQEYHGCPVFVAQDYDRAEEGDGSWAWAWTAGGWGWAGTGNCFNVKSVKCYDNSDCGQRQMCDKTQAWQLWDCKDIPKSDYFRFNAEDNTCTQVNIYADEKTANDYELRDECEGLIVTQYYRFLNESNKCETVSIPAKEKTDMDYLDQAECKQNVKTNWVAIAILGAVVIVIIVISILVFRKIRKKKK